MLGLLTGYVIQVVYKAELVFAGISAASLASRLLVVVGKLAPCSLGILTVRLRLR